MLSPSIDLARWYRPDGPGSPEQLGEFYAGLALKMVMNTVPPERAAARSAGRVTAALPAGQGSRPASSAASIRGGVAITLI